MLVKNTNMGDPPPLLVFFTNNIRITKTLLKRQHQPSYLFDNKPHSHHSEEANNDVLDVIIRLVRY